MSSREHDGRDNQQAIEWGEQVSRDIADDWNAEAYGETYTPTVGQEPLPVRPTAHERDGRDELSVSAEMARTAHGLESSGYSPADISRALVADELTIELLLPGYGEGSR